MKSKKRPLEYIMTGLKAEFFLGKHLHGCRKSILILIHSDGIIHNCGLSDTQGKKIYSLIWLGKMLLIDLYFILLWHTLNKYILLDFLVGYLCLLLHKSISTTDIFQYSSRATNESKQFCCTKKYQINIILSFERRT